MKSRDERLVDLERGLALGLSRREILKRALSWLGVALTPVFINSGITAPKPVDAAEWAPQLGRPALLQLNGTQVLVNSTPVSVNGTSIPVTLHEYCGVEYCVTVSYGGRPAPTTGVEFTAPTIVRLNGATLPLAGASGTSAVDSLPRPLGSYCVNSTCFSLYPNPRVSLNGTTIVLNSTPVVYCGPSFCVTADKRAAPTPPTDVPFAAPAVVVNGTPLPSTGPADIPNAESLGPAVASYCDANYCYSLYPAPGGRVAINGTAIPSPIPAAPAGPPTVNGTVIVNGASLLHPSL